MWDGKIRLFSIQTGEIYFGLLSYIEEFAKRNDIEIEYKEGVKDGEQLGDSELDTFIGRVSPQSKGKTLQVRDYQMGIYYAIKNNHSLGLVLPSGKSLIIYILSVWYA